MAKKRKLREGNRVQSLMKALADKGKTSPSLQAWLGRNTRRPEPKGRSV